MARRTPRETTAQRRRALFKLYAANYAIYDPALAKSHGPFFRCPICGNAFNELAVDVKSVDLAHVYPRSCGGKLATLTCQNCNNRLGTMCDSHVKRYTDFWNALGPKGTGVIPAKMIVDGLTAGIHVSNDGGHFNIRNILKQTNPELLSRFGPGKKFSMTVRAANPFALNVALLHSAYLSVFRMFAYEYLFCADTHWIRTILNAPKIPRDVSLFKMYAKSADARSALHTVGFGVVDDAYRCIVVTLPVPGDVGDAVVVALPGFGAEGKAMYEEIKKPRGDADRKMQIQWFKSRPEKWLGDPDFAFYGKHLWENGLGDEIDTTAHE